MGQDRLERSGAEGVVRDRTGSAGGETKNPEQQREEGLSAFLVKVSRKKLSNRGLFSGQSKSVSKYLEILVKKEVENQWPEGYFELFGTWQGEPLERLDQGSFEQRVEFD